MGLLDEAKKMIAIGNCKYCGGHSNITKACDGQMTVTTEKISFTSGLFKGFQIPVNSIIDNSIKSEEHISKDVTLTRLLLTGIFAFGLKKKRVETTSYLVIQYQEGGISMSVIFTGKEVAKLNAGIIKARQQLNSTMSNNNANIDQNLTNYENDIYQQIEKLNDLKNKGIITEEEFQSKKQELLSRI